MTREKGGWKDFTPHVMKQVSKLVPLGTKIHKRGNLLGFRSRRDGSIVIMADDNFTMPLMIQIAKVLDADIVIVKGKFVWEEDQNDRGDYIVEEWKKE